jgi:hypothetical protein
MARIDQPSSRGSQPEFCRSNRDTGRSNSPHPPISAQLKYNIDAVNEYIVKRIPIPVRGFKLTSDPRLIVIRSFDVNKPSAEVDELKLEGRRRGRVDPDGGAASGMEVEVKDVHRAVMRSLGGTECTCRPFPCPRSSSTGSLPRLTSTCTPTTHTLLSRVLPSPILPPRSGMSCSLRMWSSTPRSTIPRTSTRGSLTHN